MGFKDEEEVDVFDLSAKPSKPEDYGTETNMFAVEFDVSESRQAEPAKAALPFVSVSAPALDDEDEFDLKSSGSAAYDDDDDFPEEGGGVFARIRGMFAKPDFDDTDIDLDVDGDFPEEKVGFFARLKGMFAKPEFDDTDIDLDGDVDFDADSDFSDSVDISDSDDFPEEGGGGFFSKIKGMFARPDDIDDYEDSLLDDYKPVLANAEINKLPDGEINKLAKDEGSGVFELSSPAAPAAPAAAPQPEPEFEAFEPEPVVKKAEPPKGDDEFDLSASVPPPPPPLPVILPPPVFNKIAHVSLQVKDLDASVGFYANLGFTKRFEFSKNGSPFGVYLEFGKGNFIEIFKDTRRGPSAKRGGLAHFCLETPDMDAAIESLASRGIEYTQKKLGSDSTYQIWLKDPDGNEFEVHQYTPKSSQLTGKGVEADW